MKHVLVKPVDEDTVRRIAKIIGPYSAADRALAELDMRRRAGETVDIFQTPSGWVVGPPLSHVLPAADGECVRHEGDEHG